MPGQASAHYQPPPPQGRRLTKIESGGAHGSPALTALSAKVQEMKPGSMIVDRHLGGYVAGGDEATWYPVLWRWLIETQGVKSVIDVGCGEGQALMFFRGLGCGALGIDGMRQEADYIIRHDYTEGPWPPAEDFPRADLVWCCEFVEHIDEPYIGNFIETFKLAPLLLMTHAEPGQNGWHHVNCQSANYWVNLLGKEGFKLDTMFTADCRKLAATNTSPWNHFARSGLAFRRG